MVDPAWGSPNGDHKGRAAKDQASTLSSAMWVLGTAGKGKYLINNFVLITHRNTLFRMYIKEVVLLK